jgi:hypothetical protein
MATVDELISDARNFAASSNEAAASLVAEAQSAMSAIISGPFVVSTPNIGQRPNTTINTTVPEFQAPSMNVGDEPDEPDEFIDIGDIDFGDVPADTLTPPTFNEPTKPSALQRFSATAPSVRFDFEFPEMPQALENIDVIAPTLSEHAVPEKPLVQIPTFGALAPTDDLTPPSDYVERMEAAYANIAPSMRAALDGQMNAWLARHNPRFFDQMAALESKLAQYIEGGTALTPQIEDQIYERTKSKVDAEYKRVHKTAYADAAKRGLTLPDGALMSALQEARQAGANNNAAAAAEIAIKQAELEQQNVQFAITTSSQLRATVMSAALSYYGSLVSLNGQALDYAKTVLSAMIEVYNSLVKAFEAKLELYKTEAQVFEVKMRAALAVIEIYKAEIAALEALTRVDLAKVELYKGRIEALGLLADVYKTKVEAVVSQASLEKMKIDLFGAQVQAFGVEAQAKNAEWQGYSAAIGGQEARMRAFGEQVRAYAARVEAYRTTIQAKSTQMEAITSHNRNLTAQYAARVQAYSAKVDAGAKLAATQIEHNRTQLQSFQAAMNAAEANAKVNIEYWRARANLVVKEFEAVIQAAVETARVSSQSARGVAEVAVAGAKVYEGLAGSALAGMNTLVSKSDE